MHAQTTPTHKLTVVSKGLGGEDLPQCDGVGVLDLFPHVNQHHALCVHQTETYNTHMTQRQPPLSNVDVATVEFPRIPVESDL